MKNIIEMGWPIHGERSDVLLLGRVCEFLWLNVMSYWWLRCFVMVSSTFCPSHPWLAIAKESKVQGVLSDHSCSLGIFTNLQLCIAWRNLCRYCGTREKETPKLLYVQLDNTCKDKKSKYVMSYLFLLVCCGVFDEIQIFFFRVGHTTVTKIKSFRDHVFIWLTRISLPFNSCAFIWRTLAL